MFFSLQEHINYKLDHTNYFCFILFFTFKCRTKNQLEHWCGKCLLSDFSFTQTSQGRSSSSSTISNTAPFKGCKGKIMHVASRAEHEPDDLTVLVHVKQETESQANAIC
ncbi:unnamed protein product [Natator depressus]